MTVLEFFKLSNFNIKIQVRSGYNGKILCKNFNPKKHTAIAERIVSGFEPGIQVSSDKSFAYAYIDVWVAGDVEYYKEYREVEE